MYENNTPSLTPTNIACSYPIASVFCAQSCLQIEWPTHSSFLSGSNNPRKSTSTHGNGKDSWTGLCGVSGYEYKLYDDVLHDIPVC